MHIQKSIIVHAYVMKKDDRYQAWGYSSPPILSRVVSNFFGMIDYKVAPSSSRENVNQDLLISGKLAKFEPTVISFSHPDTCFSDVCDARSLLGGISLTRMRLYRDAENLKKINERDVIASSKLLRQTQDDSDSGHDGQSEFFEKYQLLSNTDKRLMTAFMEVMRPRETLSSAPELYAERENKSETVPDFLVRVYQSRGALNGDLTRSHIRALDSKLYQAIANWERTRSLPEHIYLPKTSEHSDSILAEIMKESETSEEMADSIRRAYNAMHIVYRRLPS